MSNPDEQFNPDELNNLEVVRRRVYTAIIKAADPDVPLSHADRSWLLLYISGLEDAVEKSGQLPNFRGVVRTLEELLGPNIEFTGGDDAGPV